MSSRSRSTAPRLPGQWLKLDWKGRNGGDWVQAASCAGPEGATRAPVGPPGRAPRRIPGVETPRPIRRSAKETSRPPGEALARSVCWVQSTAWRRSGGGRLRWTRQGAQGRDRHTAAAGQIPKDAIQLRFPRLDGWRFDTLMPSRPTEVAVRKRHPGRSGASSRSGLTVNIPRAAAAGQYSGDLTGLG